MLEKVPHFLWYVGISSPPDIPVNAAHPHPRSHILVRNFMPCVTTQCLGKGRLDNGSLVSTGLNVHDRTHPMHREIRRRDMQQAEQQTSAAESHQRPGTLLVRPRLSAVFHAVALCIEWLTDSLSWDLLLDGRKDKCRMLYPQVTTVHIVTIQLFDKRPKYPHNHVLLSINTRGIQITMSIRTIVTESAISTLCRQQFQYCVSRCYECLLRRPRGSSAAPYPIVAGTAHLPRFLSRA
jgi:hypothetical protein